jgi:hypothetical protein
LDVVEEKVEKHISEGLVFEDLLVQLNVAVDHVVERVLCGRVEGQARVAAAVDFDAFLDGVPLLDVFLELLDELDEDAVVLSGCPFRRPRRSRR